jgi:TRAP-type mannitol/chloroaromatic compound transport system permease small subunit
MPALGINRIVVLRVFAALMAASLFLFLVDNILIFWFEQPGLRAILIHSGLITSDKNIPLNSGMVFNGWIQFFTFSAVIFGALFYCLATPSKQFLEESILYTRIAAYIVRAAFWSVLLVGLVDMVISFLRVEGFLKGMIGEHLTTQLGRSIFRGSFVHFPLIILGFTIAAFNKSLGFIWLALLIVAAEFLIVLTRFIFSYEQAFMGDLVRFWYAGLFLFASAYTLVNDGHVRVDVLYASFSEQGKSITNIFGSLLLGLPLCWNILIQGMSGKGSIINSPILSFEISQSGFGMYTKYLMAGYLVIFALSMGIQFIGFILKNLDSFQCMNQTQNIKII